MEEKEVLVKFPKDTVKDAFKYEINDDGLLETFDLVEVNPQHINRNTVNSRIPAVKLILIRRIYVTRRLRMSK